MWDYCGGASPLETASRGLASGPALPHLAMLLIRLLAPAFGSNPICDIFNASRVWWTTGDCVVQGQTIDLGENEYQDLSVANLFGEIGKNPDGKYHAIQFRDTTLKNGVVNVNLNLTLTEKDTEVVVFGLQKSSFVNVTVQGIINVYATCAGEMAMHMKLFDSETNS